MLAGTFDGTVLEWDASTGRCLREVGGTGGNACLNEVSADDHERRGRGERRRAGAAGPVVAVAIANGPRPSNPKPAASS